MSKAEYLYDLIAAKTEFFSANSGQCFEFVYPKHVKKIAEQHADQQNKQLQEEVKRLEVKLSSIYKACPIETNNVLINRIKNIANNKGA